MEVEPLLPTADLGQLAPNRVGILARQGVEEREVGRNDVPLGRVIAPPQAVQAGEGGAVERDRQDERSGARSTQNCSAARASSSCEMAVSAASRAL